jgi:hypothetical protein
LVNIEQAERHLCDAFGEHARARQNRCGAQRGPHVDGHARLDVPRETIHSMCNWKRRLAFRSITEESLSKIPIIASAYF